MGGDDVGRCEISVIEKGSLTYVRTRASSSLNMIRAVAANHVQKDSMQQCAERVCNRVEGSMVELAEILMRL